MGQGGVSIGALCNAASDYLIGRCLSTTVFQTSSIKPSSKNVGPSYSAAYFFFFSLFSLILNGLDRDLTIHFWFQPAKLNLPAPPFPTTTLENCTVRQVSQFHEVEAVSKQRRASLLEVWHKGCMEIYYSLHCLDLIWKRTCLMHGYCAAVGWQQWSWALFSLRFLW